MKSKTKHLNISRESLAEALHVALRKCCDSNPTSILWNLIHLMDEGTWEKYLDHAWIAFQIADGTDEQYWQALRRASLAFNDQIHRQRISKLDHHSITIMDIVFEQFTDRDWQGFAAYLSEGDE